MRRENVAGTGAADAASKTTVAAAPAPPPAAAPSPELERAAVTARSAQAIESSADEQAAQATNGFPPHLAALVKADAAKRTGVDPDQVTIVSADAVTWPDGALGCRTPGEIAIDVLTPGYRVEVEAAGKRLRFHTDTRERIRVCARLGSPR